LLHSNHQKNNFPISDTQSITFSYTANVRKINFQSINHSNYQKNNLPNQLHPINHPLIHSNCQENNSPINQSSLVTQQPSEK
jgi:hypothetical protein